MIIKAVTCYYSFTMVSEFYLEISVDAIFDTIPDVIVTVENFNLKNN